MTATHIIAPNIERDLQKKIELWDSVKMHSRSSTILFCDFLFCKDFYFLHYENLNSEIEKGKSCVNFCSVSLLCCWLCGFLIRHKSRPFTSAIFNLVFKGRSSYGLIFVDPVFSPYSSSEHIITLWQKSTFCPKIPKYYWKWWKLRLVIKCNQNSCTMS